jgi:hypothetical protein
MTRALEPGDIIWANRIAKGLPYNHCGVYAGDGKVIHFAAPAGSEINMENAVIHITTIERFQDNCPLKIIDFPENVHCYSGEETVKRALSRIGEKGYNFLTNNCDHFAIWCKTGKHCSYQVETVKNTIRATGSETGEILCNVYDIIESFKSPGYWRNNMAKNVDSGLCKEIVSMLANIGGSAETVITEAVNSCDFHIARPGWVTQDGNKVFWAKLAEDNGWIIEQHKGTKHIRLLNPQRKCEVSIMLEHKISEFFSKLLKIGTEELVINNYFSDLALNKEGEFIVLVGKMGAKFVHTIRIDDQNTRFGLDGTVSHDGGYHVQSFTVNIGAQVNNDLKNFKEYEVSFEGKSIDSSGLKNLIQNSKWFKNDAEMNALVISLLDKNVKSWKYKSSFSKDFKLDFSAAARSIGVGEANLKSAFEKRKGFYTEFTVQFS